MGEIIVLSAIMAMTTPGSAAEIAHRLERLRTPVRVLYVAAHPDDENTQLLTWLARGKKVRAAYLSLTRGDGGQNLIGPEQRPLLGVIRTHELLAARRLDGAEQLFTRLRDFGYSKSSEEALKKWGPDTALNEVVRVFRTFRPHVVITRFPETGDTHGHHLASAQLARKAYFAAGDARQFPEQLQEGLSVWKPRRLFYNFPHFFSNRGIEPPEGVRFDVEIGGYDAWLGTSHGEISGYSRSMHKSQGFGASARIGSWKEPLILLEGDRPEASDPFDGLQSWATIPGGGSFADAIKEVIASMDGRNPSSMIPFLGQAHKAAASIEDLALRAYVQAEIEALLVDTAGLYIEARSEVAEVSAGSELPVTIRVVARAPETPVVIRKVSGPGFEQTARVVLENNESYKETIQLAVDADAQPTRSHWLESSPEPTIYEVAEPNSAVRPVIESPFQVSFELGIGGIGLYVQRPVLRHWVDPVLGERTERLEVAPPVSVTPEVEVMIVPAGQSQKLAVEVQAGPLGFSGDIGWSQSEKILSPPTQKVTLAPGASTRLLFTVEGTLKARSSVRATYSAGSTPVLGWSRRVIDHPHIPRVTHRTPATVELVPSLLNIPQGLYGYIPGSGDSVAEILGRLGMKIESLDARALLSADLSKYKAILTGIRAFNVNDSLLQSQSRLMDYVKAGGTLVVQYNTKNWSAKLDVPIGPYPVSIFRGRVTDETAAVTILRPEHKLLSSPHKITEADFLGWVQERGLYFAENWAKEYTPLFSMHDAGEAALEGSTLYTKYGKGHYVFSGLSFFRQLPAGNPGALRLLINFLSASETSSEAVERSKKL